MKQPLTILFILLCLFPVASFGADTDKPIVIAWNFQIGFGWGMPSSGGTPEATYFVLLPSSTDNVLLPSSTDKVKLPGH